MTTSITEALRYNRWANVTLFEACRELTSEQLAVHAPGTSGGVGELLTHIAGGQQTIVLRTKGRQHEGELTRMSQWPGIDTLIDIVRETSDQLINVAGEVELSDEIVLPYLGKRYRFPPLFFLVHALEHGVEHRTEVKVALASIGVATPDLDGWGYAAAAGYGAEVT